MVVGPAGFVPSFSGMPVPLQLIGGPMVQPAICRLAGLTSFGIVPARKAACTSAMALITLLAQSPEAMKRQLGAGLPLPSSGVGSPTVAGVASSPEFPTV